MNALSRIALPLNYAWNLQCANLDSALGQCLGSPLENLYRFSFEDASSTEFFSAILRRLFGEQQKLTVNASDLTILIYAPIGSRSGPRRRTKETNSWPSFENEHRPIALMMIFCSCSLFHSRRIVGVFSLEPQMHPNQPAIRPAIHQANRQANIGY